MKNFFLPLCFLLAVASGGYAQSSQSGTGQGGVPRKPISNSTVPDFNAYILNLSVDCSDASGRHNRLPAEIGIKDGVHRELFSMPCDTMVVPKGTVTTVHPNTMLFFKNPSLNSTIKVEGRLLLKGNKDASVYISASVDTLDRFKRAYEPGQKMWSGIEVAPGGSLRMEFSIIVGAPTPLTAFSEQVLIRNSLFKGASGMIMPDGEVTAMETALHTIVELNMADPKPAAKVQSERANIVKPSEVEKARLFEKKSSFWTSGRVWSGLAVFAAAGVGTAVYLWYPSPDSSPPGQPPLADKNPLDNPDEVFKKLFENQKR